MKRTNCPKFFVRTKVDNSGSCENTSTRNKIFIVTIFLKMHNAQVFASQASGDKKLSGCLVYLPHLSLRFPARGWTKWCKWHWAAVNSLGVWGLWGHLICISLIRYIQFRVILHKYAVGRGYADVLVRCCIQYLLRIYWPVHVYIFINLSDTEYRSIYLFICPPSIRSLTPSEEEK